MNIKTAKLWPFSVVTGNTENLDVMCKCVNETDDTCHIFIRVVLLMKSEKLFQTKLWMSIPYSLPLTTLKPFLSD
ncbi:CLUMA_CG000396, isoform A [Clunio marinus]|uniref:CLUMA_CG000396, isoform A n=1 Tax=Clunio marinus TaxID=568069 RepID=A0A1J1HIR3_9DIPT|nr:CLUMA_CG000396, isoform A [Clunio marinus]